jgi:hypothetical protein
MNPTPDDGNEESGEWRYFLACQDVWSRRIFAVPLKNKSAASVKQAFEVVFKEYAIVPKVIEVRAS